MKEFTLFSSVGGGMGGCAFMNKLIPFNVKFETNEHKKKNRIKTGLPHGGRGRRPCDNKHLVFLIV